MSSQNEQLKEEKTKLEKELDGLRSAIESFDQEVFELFREARP